MPGLINEQQRAEISVTALVVPPALWAAAGEELMAFLKTEYARISDRGVASRWVTRALGERTVQYATREDSSTAPREDTGLDTF